MKAHRCRFLDMKDVSVSHTCEVNEDKVIVCRNSGDLEIWCRMNNQWNCENIIQTGVAVESIVIANDSIFVSTEESLIIQYSVALCTEIQRVESFGGGAVWCLALSFNRLFAGCEDGCIRVFDISHGQLSYLTAFQKLSSRIISLNLPLIQTSNKRKMGKEPMENILFSGSSDGIIRKWDTKTGNCIQRLNVEKGVLIWNLISLQGNVLASADSTGRVQLWDQKSCTLLQSFKPHSADALVLASNKDGTAFFSSGVDGKFAFFQKIDDSTNASVQNSDSLNKTVQFDSTSKWIFSSQRKMLTHDVRALTWVDSKNHSFLLSGGLDSYLLMMHDPINRFQNTSIQPQRISPFAVRRSDFVQVCANKRMVVGRIGDRLSIWKLESNVSSGNLFSLDKNKSAQNNLKIQNHELVGRNPVFTPTFLLEIILKKGSVPRHYAISPNGIWIVIGDQKGLKLFKLIITEDNKVSIMDVSNLIPGPIIAQRLLFSDDSDNIFIATVKGKLQSFNIPTGVLTDLGGNFQSSSPIVHFRVAKEFIIVGNVSNQFFVLQWTVPSIPVVNLPVFEKLFISSISVAQLRTSSSVDSVVLFACSLPTGKNTIRCISLSTMSFHPSLDSLSQSIDLFKKRSEKIHSIHIAFEPIYSSSTAVYKNVMYSCSDKWVIRTVIPDSSETKDDLVNLKSKLQPFDNLLAFEFLDTEGKESIVVEKPWKDIIASLPAPLETKVYGQ